MLTLLILLGMAYAQDNRNFNLPAYVWAGMFAIIHLVIGIFGKSCGVACAWAVCVGVFCPASPRQRPDLIMAFGVRAGACFSYFAKCHTYALTTVNVCDTNPLAQNGNFWQV